MGLLLVDNATCPDSSTVTPSVFIVLWGMFLGILALQLENMVQIDNVGPSGVPQSALLQQHPVKKRETLSGPKRP